MMLLRPVMPGSTCSRSIARIVRMSFFRSSSQRVTFCQCSSVARFKRFPSRRRVNETRGASAFVLPCASASAASAWNASACSLSGNGARLIEKFCATRARAALTGLIAVGGAFGAALCLTAICLSLLHVTKYGDGLSGCDDRPHLHEIGLAGFEECLHQRELQLADRQDLLPRDRLGAVEPPGDLSRIALQKVRLFLQPCLAQEYQGRRQHPPEHRPAGLASLVVMLTKICLCHAR